MFWRGRKRKDAALKAAQRAVTEPKINTPLPTSSYDEDDTAEAVVNDEEEREEEEEEEPEEEQVEEEQVEEAPEERPAVELSPEDRLERKRQDAMEEQKVNEIQALASNSFCKNQRVQYLHKASGRRFEAVVMAVHFDDGVDRPYFTVRYEMGSETIEKQTTSDRLSYVAFDEAKTYEIISSKIKI